MELASQLWNPHGRYRLVAPDGSYEVLVVLLEDGHVQFKMMNEPEKEPQDDDDE